LCPPSRLGEEGLYGREEAVQVEGLQEQPEV